MTFHTYLAAVKHHQQIRYLKQAKVCKVVNSQAVPKKEDYSNFKHLVRLNRNAKIVIAGIVVIFNIIFWSIALREYTKPYEQLLEQ